MSIAVKKFNDTDVKDRWLSFCDSNLNCWLHHKGVLFLEDRNLSSFVLVEDGHTVAICPIITETVVDDEGSFNVGSLFGLSLPCPVVSGEIEKEKHLKKIRKIIYGHIQEEATRHDIAKISFNFSSCSYAGKSSDLMYNELTRYGFLGTSLSMRLLDLRLSEEELWKNLSKGHRSILKKFINISKCKHLDRDNLPLKFDKFSEIVSTIANFPESELKYLYALYQEGHVEICHLFYQDEIIGSAVFLKYGSAVQFHAAERFTDKDIPVHHLLLWGSAKKFKRESYKLMDFGVSSYYSQLNYIASEKTRTIAVFKQGFGCNVLPFVMGERYFNRGYFEKEYNNRISKYKETIQR